MINKNTILSFYEQTNLSKIDSIKQVVRHEFYKFTSIGNELVQSKYFYQLQPKTIFHLLQTLEHVCNWKKKQKKSFPRKIAKKFL